MVFAIIPEQKASKHKDLCHPAPSLLPLCPICTSPLGPFCLSWATWPCLVDQARLILIPYLPQATLSSFSFLRRHSSHSLAMRPQRIHVSSSRWLRLEEAEELDTSEEPLFLREPFMERMDLESASRSLGERRPENSSKSSWTRAL